MDKNVVKSEMASLSEKLTNHIQSLKVSETIPPLELDVVIDMISTLQERAIELRLLNKLQALDVPPESSVYDTKTAEAAAFVNSGSVAPVAPPVIEEIHPDPPVEAASGGQARVAVVAQATAETQQKISQSTPAPASAPSPNRPNIQEPRINDLTKAFGLNERIYFIKSLFGNDGLKFSEAVSSLNSSVDYNEACKKLEHLAQVHGWDLNSQEAETFYRIIRRRFQ